MTSTTSISKAAAALGRVSSPAKTAAARENARLGGRPSKKATYTVREPGMSYWWQGARLGEARRELRAARAQGLSRARIYVERDGETTELESAE